MGGEARPPPLDMPLEFGPPGRDRYAADRHRGIHGIVDRRIPKFRNVRNIGVGHYCVGAVYRQRSDGRRRALVSFSGRTGREKQGEKW